MRNSPARLPTKETHWLVCSPSFAAISTRDTAQRTCAIRSPRVRFSLPTATNKLGAVSCRATTTANPRVSKVVIQGVVRGEALSDLLRPQSIVRPSGVQGAKIATDEPFEVLQGRLGSKTRSRLRAARRKLGARGDVRMVCLADAQALDALPQFLALEASGWKGRAGTGIANLERTASFYRDLAGRFAALGALRIQSLQVGGEAVAGHLCFQHGTTLFLQKIAYNEALAKHSPGHVLWECFMQMCCEDDAVRLVDTIGTDDIRRRWHCDTYTYDDMYFFPRTLRGWEARTRTKLRAAAGRAVNRWNDWRLRR